MTEIKKRYRLKILGRDGSISDFWAYDLETASEQAARFSGARIFAVYTRPRNNMYLDEDEYWVEVK